MPLTPAFCASTVACEGRGGPEPLALGIGCVVVLFALVISCVGVLAAEIPEGKEPLVLSTTSGVDPAKSVFGAQESFALAAAGGPEPLALAAGCVGVVLTDARGAQELVALAFSCVGAPAAETPGGQEPFTLAATGGHGAGGFSWSGRPCCLAVTALP